MQKLAGITFIVGSLLVQAAAFSRIFNQYFQEPDVQKRIEIVEADPTGWAFNRGLFVAGIAVAGVGFLLLAWHIRRSQDAATRLIGYLAAVAGGIAAALALRGFFAEASRTPQEIATAPVDWTAYAFILLTQLALLATGVVLLRAGYPGCLGWTVLILTRTDLDDPRAGQRLPPAASVSDHAVHRLRAGCDANTRSARRPSRRPSTLTERSS
jgi:hypothetical protein